MRIAAVGDLHCRADTRAALAAGSQPGADDAIDIVLPVAWKKRLPRIFK